MTQDEIRLALENAVGKPKEALREAARQAPAFAPAVIDVAQRMAGGCLPLPHEERLLYFGLHALAAAHETSACPAFVALLRRPPLEQGWLFGEDRTQIVAGLLLGLFDGDDSALCALAAEPDVDSYVQTAVLLALARLVWQGRASRERLLELLDRFDREELAPAGSWAWTGWQDAIMLLGLTDWIERVQRGWDAGRVPDSFRETDRQDWIERTRAAAERPADPQRFVDEGIESIEDVVASVGWSSDPPSGPRESPSGDEMDWLNTALWRCVTAGTMCLEEADGFLTALAAGPVRVPAAEYLPEIFAADGETPRFDTPQHAALVADLLTRHHASIESDLESGEDIAPWISEDVGDLEGVLWARGYMRGVALRHGDWQKLIRDKPIAESLLLPILLLLSDPEAPADEQLLPTKRGQLIRALPEFVQATKAFWQEDETPLPDRPLERTPKVGRNQPCPCGSGKKFKKCCGAVA